MAKDNIIHIATKKLLDLDVWDTEENNQYLYHLRDRECSLSSQVDLIVFSA